MKLLSLCFGLVLVACGGGGGGADGGGGGGDGGGGGGGSSCDDVCDAMFAQSCFYGGGEADCRTSCNGWNTQYTSTGADYCQTAWADYRTCMTSASLTCADDGNPDWGAIECRGDWDHVQNYCVYRNATPATPCMVNAAFDAFCTSTPATPEGRSCLGDAPAGCVVGGTQNNANLYCCPAT